MAIRGCLLAGIVLVVWCQTILVVSPDRLSHGFNYKYQLEESNIEVKYPTRDTLTRRPKPVKQETLKGRYDPVMTPCGDDLCLCSKTHAYCLNQGRNLSYIPKLPDTTKYLNFSHNYLPYLDNTTFFNLTFLNLIHIELGGNGLKNCSSDAFANLKHLGKLVIKDEELLSDSLMRCFAGLDLYRLYLFGVTFTDGFKSDLFSKIKDNSVEQIYIDESNIIIYNQSAFSHFTKLEKLHLCGCQISVVIVDYAPNLNRLSLVDNSLSKIPDFCENGGDLYPRLISLALDYNKITNIPQQNLECLKSLTNLSISDNSIFTVEPNTFSRIPKLRVINLVFNHEERFVIKGYAFNSSSLTRLFLQGNTRHLTQTLSIDAFKDCPNLKALSLENNKLQQDNENASNAALQRLLGPLSNLEVLDLTRTQISELPSVIPQRMPKLEYLYANINFISQWPSNYFDNLTNLRRVDLMKNKITVIKKTSFSTECLRTIERLSFQGNPFSCNCDLLWFLDYAKTDNNSRKLEYWPNKYTCDSPSELQGILLNNVRLNDHICLEKQLSSPIIYASVALLTLVLCMSGVYRYRWKLRYLVYMIRFQQIRYQRLNEHDGNLYDLYLSSSEEDFDFILEHIVPKLENELELRLYIPQRDGIGYMVDAIVTNMDVSKKALLFVSDSYIQDQYCQLEATIAFDRYVNTRRNMMIVVLLDELPEMNKTIYKILNVDEYIMWSDGEENVRLFWRKLENSIQSNDDLRY